MRFVNVEASTPQGLTEEDKSSVQIASEIACGKFGYEIRRPFDSSSVAPVQQMRAIDAVKRIINSFDVNDGSYKLTDVDMILLDQMVNNCDEEMLDNNGRPWADWDLYYDVTGNPLEPRTFTEGPYTITLPPETDEQLETIRNWQLFCEEQDRLLGGKRAEIYAKGGYDAVAFEVSKVKDNQKLMNHNIRRYETQQRLINEKTEEFAILKKELQRKYNEYKARESTREIQNVLVDDVDRYGDMWDKPYSFRQILDSMSYEEVRRMLLNGERDMMYQVFQYFNAQVPQETQEQINTKCQNGSTELTVTEYSELIKAICVSSKILEGGDDNLKELDSVDIEIINEKLMILNDVLEGSNLTKDDYVSVLRQWLISVEPVKRILEQKKLISIDYNIANKDFNDMRQQAHSQTGGNTMNINLNNTNNSNDPFGLFSNNNNNSSNNSSSNNSSSTNNSNNFFNNSNSNNNNNNFFNNNSSNNNGNNFFNNNSSNNNNNFFNNNNNNNNNNNGGGLFSGIFSSSNNGTVKWDDVEVLLNQLWENRQFVREMSDYTYNTAWKDMLTAIHKKDRKTLPNIVRALMDRASQDGSIQYVDTRILTQILAIVSPQTTSDGSKYSDDYSNYQNVGNSNQYSNMNTNTANVNSSYMNNSGRNNKFGFYGFNSNNSSNSNPFGLNSGTNGGGRPSARFTQDNSNGGSNLRRPGGTY